jgi:hypothetical protein
MSALAPADALRLVKLLGMLGSTYAGERAAAGLKAHNLVTERRLAWSDVIAPVRLAPPSSSSMAGAREHQGRAMRLLNCGFGWNDWERKFLLSIARWHGDLTAKQTARLRDLGAAAEAWLKTQEGGDVEF